jgi:hypothetical protein
MQIDSNAQQNQAQPPIQEIDDLSQLQINLNNYLDLMTKAIRGVSVRSGPALPDQELMEIDMSQSPREDERKKQLGIEPGFNQ